MATVGVKGLKVQHWFVVTYCSVKASSLFCMIYSLVYKLSMTITWKHASCH